MAEIQELMSVKTQIISPQSSKPCIGCVQDTVVGLYLLSSTDVTMDPDRFYQGVCQLRYPHDVDHTPSVLAPRRLYTGLQLVSALMPPALSMECHGVTVVAGNVLRGRITSRFCGRSVGSVVHWLCLELSTDAAMRFISDAQRLVAWWMCVRGFSIGVSDCAVSEETRVAVRRVVDACVDTAECVVRECRDDDKEAHVIHTLQRSIDLSGSAVIEALQGGRNRFLACVDSGAKGSNINVAQVMGCVGQQCANGARVRLAPALSTGGAVDSGFCASNYIDGLSTREFFAHAMGGREGRSVTRARGQASPVTPPLRAWQVSWTRP